MAHKITSFEDLTVWQECQTLAVEVYKITKDFPQDELFAMTSQLRRAAYSVSANIAEGFGRTSIKDKLHFYTIAYGSLLETKNFIYLAEKLDYAPKESLDTIVNHITSCQKLLNAFKRSISQ